MGAKGPVFTKRSFKSLRSMQSTQSPLHQRHQIQSVMMVSDHASRKWKSRFLLERNKQATKVNSRPYTIFFYSSIIMHSMFYYDSIFTWIGINFLLFCCDIHTNLYSLHKDIYFFYLNLNISFDIKINILNGKIFIK